MYFDRKTQLGLVLILLLASKHSNVIQPAAVLAKELCISESYLQQISKHLRTHGLIKSHRGPCGGYSLAKSVENISIAEVIRAMKKPHIRVTSMHSKEDILWIKTYIGLLNYLDTMPIKTLVLSEQKTSQHESTQRDHYSYLQKLII